MRLSELKASLTQVEKLIFTLPEGEKVPLHFHLTELGQLSKRFIDCGGTLREESSISLQLWHAGDVYHRLAPAKLIDIIALAEAKLHLEDAEIEVEYKAETIGKYGLEFDGEVFQLTSRSTACLATDKCGIPESLLPLSQVVANSSACCTPGGGCC